jgi:hypothetical protein
MYFFRSTPSTVIYTKHEKYVSKRAISLNNIKYLLEYGYNGRFDLLQIVDDH